MAEWLTEYWQINSGAVVDIRARTEVHLTDGFEAHAGSEVHIYNAETFPDCADFSAFTRMTQTSGRTPHVGHSAPKRKDVEVDFKKQSADFGVLLFPNPATGMLNINIQGNNESNSEINFYNLQGSKVLELVSDHSLFVLDISHLAKGIYYVRVCNEENIIIKKLVIQ
jgi:hypothetical protein